MIKRAFALAVAATLAAAASEASAQAYPNRPVRILVPFPAGAGVDIVARMLGVPLTDLWGQAAVVDNRPGAGGIIGSDIVAKALPDGYTLLMVFPSHPVNPSLNAKMPYDTVNDFAPISMASRVTQVLLVHPSLPVTTVKELIAYAKARPKQLNYGTVGRGSFGHVSTELFASQAGIDLVHITYKGVPQIIGALLSGEIQVYFNVPISAIGQIRAGKMRAFGVTKSERLAMLPEVPTIAEAGLPGFEAIGWNGILAPAATPRALIERLHREIVAALRNPEVLAQLTAQGIEPVGSTPEEFGQIIRVDVAKWSQVLRRAGVHPG